MPNFIRKKATQIFSTCTLDGSFAYQRFQEIIFETLPSNYQGFIVKTLGILYRVIYKELSKLEIFQKIAEVRSTDNKQIISSSFWKYSDNLWLVVGRSPGKSQYTDFYIYSDNLADAKKLIRLIQNNWIESVTNINHINADFLSWHGQDIRYNTRQLKTLPLSEIQKNYSTSTITQVKNLLALEKPDQLGKIVFWHGPPGTGKTFLLRSLLQHWHHQLHAQIEIILDPEVFFSNACYMQDFLSRDLSTETLRILVMEDAGCHLDISSRQKSGFARLLNLTDGLLGQGQRLLCVFTANEKVDLIDPAILRAGRCLQQLEINPLSTEEAKNWLEIKKVKVVEPLKDTSLANLYELTRQNILSRQETGKKLGF